MDLTLIGKNIQKYRTAKNLRQEDLAELSGVTTKYIGSIERGIRIPSIEILVSILNALEVSSDKIFNGVTEHENAVDMSALSADIEGLSNENKRLVYDVVKTLVDGLK